MKKKRLRIKLEFETDLDMVLGWGYDPKDWIEYVKIELSRQSHYNPKVKILSSSVN